MTAPRPSAPPLLHGVIYVTPISTWNGPPSEPPPPYSESPVTPFHESNRNVCYHGIMPLEPGYRHVSQITEPPSNTQNDSETREVNDRKKEMKINKKYLSSNFAVLKALEFVSCFVGFSACLSFRLEQGLSAVAGDRSGFFIILLAFCWLLVIVLFWTSLIGYIDGIRNEATFIKMMIIHISFGGLVLVSASLLADIQMKQLCISENASCLSFKISLGSGFLTMILFWIDAALHCAAFRGRFLQRT